MAIKLKKICEKLHIESREVVGMASQLGKEIADDPNTRLCDDDVRNILKMKFPDDFEKKLEILYTLSNTSQVSSSNEDEKDIICQRVRKELLDYECVNSFLDLLIVSIEDKLDINIDDYPIGDDGTPTIDNIMVKYLGWATAIASKVINTPDLETFIAKIRTDLLNIDIDIDIETLRRFAYDMIDKCIDEIRAWQSVTTSFLQYQTINDKMITAIAEHFNLY